MKPKSNYLRTGGKAFVSVCILFVTAYRFITCKLDDFLSNNREVFQLFSGKTTELIFAILSLAMICGAICYTIFNFERFYSCFRSTTEKQGVATALFLATSFALSLSPLDPSLNNVKGFNRLFGAGFMAGEDVSRRISSFTVWIVMFAGSFALLFLFIHYLYHQETQNKDRSATLDFLRDFMVVANCCLVFRGILFFNTETNQLATINDFTTKAILLIAFDCLIYLVFHLDRNIRFNSYLQLHFVLFCLSFPALIIFGLKWQDGDMLFGLWLLMTIIANAVLILQKGRRLSISDKISQGRFTATLAVSALIPFITSAYIELIHILNQWNIFVGRPALIYTIGICCLIILGISRDMISWGKASDIRMSGTSGHIKWLLAMFVFGMACLATQIQLSSWYDFDLFEGANYGVLINDLLNFGKIPIAEHYGGHQMTSVWSGLIYGLLNQDYAAAYVAPYMNLATAVMAVIFFFLVREIWNERMAVLVALLIPYNHMWSYYGMGVMVCLTAVAFVRKSTYPKAFLFWLSCIWCATYRLDLGFTFGVSAVIALGIYLIRTKNGKAGKKLLITLAIEGMIAAGLWFICCIAKQINPISRLKEFLSISFSNQNWSYQGIGNAGDMAFGWFYLFLPFAVALGILAIAFSGKIRESMTHDKWVLALMLGLAFLFNFSRGLVRHSWHEKQTFILAFTGYLFLSFAVSIWLENKKLFLPAFVLLLICNNLLVTGSNMSVSAIAESSVSAPSSIVESWTDAVYSDQEDGDKKITYWEYLQQNQQKVERIKIPENKRSIARTYGILIDLLLEDDETFVDFTNVATLYPLLNRECPVYISQSPSMLSGEFAQEEFVQEIEGVPLVIMPGTIDISGLSIRLDGISNYYRHYIVAEYIYQKYVPLCKYSEKYTLWCLREKKDVYQSKLSRVISEGLEYKDKLINCDGITLHNMTLLKDPDGAIVLSVTDIDPFVTNVEKVLDIRALAGTESTIIVDYSMEQAGVMEFLYTTEPGETITGQKVVTIPVSDSGTAEFHFPVTENTILRFDVPDAGVIKIHSMRMKLPLELIDYGYDGPFEVNTEDGSKTWRYNDATHVYSLQMLPLYWGEYDSRKATENTVLCETEERDGTFFFDTQDIDKTKGNYVKLRITWDGYDTNGLTKEYDEFCALQLILGREENGFVEEKCRYDFTVKEGMHDYLIRCSADYYWYRDEINAIRIETSESINGMTVQILEGD